MEIKTFNIGKNGAVLTAYIQKNSYEIPMSKCRPAVLIFPGGGYEMVSDREGEPIAASFMAKGFQAFMLSYTVLKGTTFPTALCEALESLQFIRQNADEFFVNPSKISVVGFSAGGHLAASVGVHCDNKEICLKAGVKSELVKPNAMVLVYPCITAGEYGYPGIKNVLGKGFSDDEFKMLSLENHVTKNTPPTYLCHTADDTAVPSMNSLLFATALAKNKVPYELHIHKSGPHGYALANVATTAEWESNLDEPMFYQKRLLYKKLDCWVDESSAFLNSVFELEKFVDKKN